jgi:chemotaxis protein MotA
LGGTLGSVFITYPWAIVKLIPRALVMVFFPPRRQPVAAIISSLVQLAEKARREGMESLQADVSKQKHPFLSDGVQMLADGLEADMIRERLDREILLTRQRHVQVTNMFRSAGSYAPIFGLLGTLIGVVQVLRNLQDPQSMGSSMAIAITTTFYGIFLANFVFMPVAGKLNYYSENELLLKELIARGILSIHRGDVPTLLSKKLEAYLSYKMRAREARRQRKAA